MLSIDSLTTLYNKTIEEASIKFESVQKKIFRISVIRVLLFLIGLSGIICLYSYRWYILAGVILLTLIPFLVLIKYHNSLFFKKNFLEKKILINKEEINALRYSYSAFDSGNEYIDPSHFYTYDLDIFGPNSLFQYINRTCTFQGKGYLARWLMKHFSHKEEIESRQVAVRELASDLKFRQNFRIIGLLYEGDVSDDKQIKEWIETEEFVSGKPFLSSLLFLAPGFNILFILLALLGIISFNWFGLSFVFFVMCSLLLQKKVSWFQNTYDKNLKILSTYATLLMMIEKREMKSPVLIQIQNKLIKDGVTASDAIKELSRKMNALDQRNNIIISIILNGLLFWELRQVKRIEQWKSKYGHDLLVWMDALGEMDGLCSLATFAYNHPDYSYPIITEDFFHLEAIDMGHPLMHRDKCVKNNIAIKKYPYFIIITGANMAGKSTYLRTIGINYLLACIGVPVNCSYMEIYPSRLITSLHTSDSLVDNESYFFAELKRLKLIIDKLTAGERLFIILDEILKGTNSMDKQKGSLALLKQFMNLDATGVIATHDLLLGTLADTYPDNISNFRFEADILNDELSFSYQLKEGVAQNMNACFLMNKMGIVVD